MGIEAATSSISVTSTSANTSTSNTSSKTSSDASFKDEMTKVSNTDDKKEVSQKETKDAKSNDTKENKEVLGTNKSDEKKPSAVNNQDNNTLDGQINFNQFAMNDANMMLSNDIAQMVENSASLSSINKSWTIGFGSESKNNIKMNESDAQFFLNLTQDGDVSMQNITVQGQNMLNSGADIAEVKQNVTVSQTLLNALNDARQNNQPVRIDFDQNIAVILRVGRDGAISAQFIPSDKVAEQYLKSNIDQLRASFDEQDLPYSDLSYSNSSKEQNKRRREQNQQGE
jgi:hypothetical protein